MLEIRADDVTSNSRSAVNANREGKLESTGKYWKFARWRAFDYVYLLDYRMHRSIQYCPLGQDTSPREWPITISTNGIGESRPAMGYR